MALGRSWGDTEAERAAHYPCDDVVDPPYQEAWRAVDVDAPAPLVWRWLCQLRVAPYSYDWIDNRGRRSPQELTPGLDELEKGQKAVAVFRIADFERERSITLHAPKSVFGNVAMSYVVTPIDDDRSRLVAKIVLRYTGVARMLTPAVIAGDWVMMRKQLLTLKECAERDHERNAKGM